MKHKTRNTDYYDYITNAIITELERGVAMWNQEWHGLGLAENLVTGRTYRGINAFMLNYATMLYRYRTPYFLTFQQAQAAGGRIRKNARSLPIMYWATYENKAVTMTDPQTGENSHPTFMIAKQHRVFNLDQTEGISCDLLETARPTGVAAIDTCEQVVAHMPGAPSIVHGGDRAFYQVGKDQVTMPLFGLFKNAEGYYSTLFHELGHSTGHISRLHRSQLYQLDDLAYSKEELTAEFTASFLCGVTGIRPATKDNHAGYIQGWLAALKGDKTLLVRAAAQAQAAADYILGVATHSPENGLATNKAA